ncbi:phage tail protein [Anabaena azotica]|uniref:Phage tail protein I n=1 Tax=Anabaena azotica FACHB-119 TaxID=947527 RepID=A0ABR8D9N4_9NOST|nr:phage tail protein [Anabaena azotica]MBD2503799.1 phage tail protein I [Anabaena azotica FACHB-119]
MPPNTSKLLEYLPAIYQTDPFLGQFLLAFEKILLGANDNVSFPQLNNKHKFPDKGIEEIIAEIAIYFVPYAQKTSPNTPPPHTPDEFLSWLAGWTALSLRADLEPDIQRKFIANIIKHYQLRGTKANLEELLQIFVQAKPNVTETAQPELPDHFFTVTIALNKELQGKPQDLARQLEIANALIQLEKPAHTDYELIPVYPGTIQIEDRNSSVLGVNTILGTMPSPTQPKQ